MCRHKPRCPAANAPDGEAAHTITRDGIAGYALLCNGVLHFDDTRELLPDGQELLHTARSPPELRRERGHAAVRQ
ncbi:DUF5999 family protein [Streptomyces vinaceus]